MEEDKQKKSLCPVCRIELYFSNRGAYMCKLCEIQDTAKILARVDARLNLLNEARQRLRDDLSEKKNREMWKKQF